MYYFQSNGRVSSHYNFRILTLFNRLTVCVCLISRFTQLPKMRECFFFSPYFNLNFFLRKIYIYLFFFPIIFCLLAQKMNLMTIDVIVNWCSDAQAINVASSFMFLLVCAWRWHGFISAAGGDPHWFRWLDFVTTISANSRLHSLMSYNEQIKINK